MAKVVDSFSHSDTIAFLLELNIVRVVRYDLGLLYLDFDRFSL